ncbi:S9 family peptidase [candidate division WOR-3 bacterium]|nr:S9 family peptidase [candidate division WOR-3 bacterium]
MKYPHTKKVDIVEKIHGDKIEDPYRWLEEVESDQVQRWAFKQDELTRKFLREGGKFRSIYEGLKKVWSYSTQGTPEVKGDKMFYLAKDALQDYPVLYCREPKDDNAKVLLDPNKWSDDGSYSLSLWSVSEDGKFVVYGKNCSGSDWSEIRILDVDNGEDLPEMINWCRFTQVSWKKDSSGFFYNRFPEEGSVPPEDRVNYSKIYFHRIKTPQAEDVLVYEDKKNKEYGFYSIVTDDGKYLLVFASVGTERKNLVFMRKVEEENEFNQLIGVFDADYTYVFSIGEIIFFKTDKDAPLGRLISIDLNRPEPDYWREVISESEDNLERAVFAGGKFVVEYLHDASSIIKTFSKEGKFEREIKLPDKGMVLGLLGYAERQDLYFKFSSFLYPGTVYRYDIKSGETTEFGREGLETDVSKFIVERLFAQSRDGTKIPFFVARRKDLKIDGSNPAILYGYGGFNVPQTPWFSPTVYYWIQKGGVYALANLRGGGEFGENWHRGGMLGAKQNVFDDFIAVAQALTEKKYTKREKLAISGGSNGGLLTAACMIQRPDLFGAVVCEVGVLDMLRYHKWTVGRYWIPEYGDPENEEHFKFLVAYSPLHNVKKGENYPPILINTADTDDRVYPAHSFKFAATLQEKSNGKNPVFLRIEKKSGHGHGMSVSKAVEKTADVYSFLFKTLGIEP